MSSFLVWLRINVGPHPHARHFHTDVKHLAVCLRVCVVAPKNLVSTVEVRIWHVVQTVVRRSPLSGGANQKAPCKQYLYQITMTMQITWVLLIYGGKSFLPKVIMKCFMMVVDLSGRCGFIFLLFPVTIIKITHTFSLVILNSSDFTTENCQRFCILTIMTICKKKKIVFNISGPPIYNPIIQVTGIVKIQKSKSKRKVICAWYEGTRGVKTNFHSFLNLALVGGEWRLHASGLYPRPKSPPALIL